MTEESKRRGIPKIELVEKCIIEYLKSKPKKEIASFDLKRKIYDELFRLRKRDRQPMGKSIREAIMYHLLKAELKECRDELEKLRLRQADNVVIAIVLISSLISEKTEYYVAGKLLATGCNCMKITKKFYLWETICYFNWRI